MCDESVCPGDVGNMYPEGDAWFNQEDAVEAWKLVGAVYSDASLENYEAIALVS